MKYFIFLGILFIFVQHSIAFEVVIRGNEKTHQDVTLSELNDLLGQELDDYVLKEANRRLWNSTIFLKSFQ